METYADNANAMKNVDIVLLILIVRRGIQTVDQLCCCLHKDFKYTRFIT